jgi:T5SS/PEP-CTERM-associated repeat protein
MVVANGSAVTASIAYIGLGVDESGSVLVTGSNTVWDVDHTKVGYEGSGNIMTITDGAQVIGTISIGIPDMVGYSDGVYYYYQQGSNNVLSVTDGGQVVGTINIDGLDGALIVTNGGSVVGGGVYISGDGNTVIVAGEDSVMSNDTLQVGGTLFGSDNSLSILDGATVYSSFMGGLSTPFASDVIPMSTNNTVVVSGAGSTWEIGDAENTHISNGWLDIGDGTLLIEDGGAVLADHSSVDGVEYHDGVYDNVAEVIVDGTGSVWSNTSYLYMRGGSVTVSDGGRIDADSLETSYQGRLTVTDEGSSLNVAGAISLGYRPGFVFEILNGGAVYSDVGYIGSENYYSSLENNNSVVVSGEGSVWQNYEGLYLGGHYEDAGWESGSTGNALTVEDGGLVLVGEINSNLVSAVEGVGVIAVGDGAEMVVANESIVESGYTYIGAGTDGSSEVVVTGDSVWSNSRNLYVGYGVSNNELTIENGAAVSCNTAYVGNHSSTGNAVSVSGAGSTLSSATHLYLGGTGGDNTLLISDGATVSDSHAYFGVSETSDNNTAVVTGGGSEWNNSDGLYVGWASCSNVLTISDGGLVTSEEGRIGVYSFADDNAVVVDGADSVWNNSANLYVGWGGSDNSLSITNGGWVQNVDGYVGREVGADDNTVSVVGTDSVWDNSGSLYLGGQLIDNLWTNGGASNTLYVADGGLVTVGEDLENRNYSTIDLDPGGTVSVAGDYYQDSTSVLRFGVETNETGAPVNGLLSVGGTAEFEEGAGIDYASNVGELQFNTFYTNMLVEADTLVVAGVTNANSLDLELLDASGSLVEVIFWEDDQDIYAIAGRVYLTESAGFEAGTMMANLAGEMDDLSLLGNAGAVEMITLLNTLSGEEQNEELSQQYERGAPSYLHIQGMTDGLREITKHVSQMPAAEPEGAAGPELPEDSMRGWVKTYGRWGERSAEQTFSGYDHDVYGTVVGVDWVQGNVLVGVAGGYARSDVEQEDGDSSSATTCYGVGYMSMRDEAWFGDVSLAIGRSSIEDESGSVFSNSADYNAANIAFYCGVGRDVCLSKGGFMLTPEASILLSGYLQDSYTEEGVLARSVSAYERVGAQSGLGATLSWRQEDRGLMFCPEIGVRWLHEFNADADTIDYSLAGGTQDYAFATAGTDEDLLETGIGLSCLLNDLCSLELNADWVFGVDYDAHAVSGRMIFEF